jgi:hypothetical protein
MANYVRLWREAESYYALCDRARRVGIDLAATDEMSVDPCAVARLREAVEQAEQSEVK